MNYDNAYLSANSRFGNFIGFTAFSYRQRIKQSVDASRKRLNASEAKLFAPFFAERCQELGNYHLRGLAVRLDDGFPMNYRRNSFRPHMIGLAYYNRTGNLLYGF